MENDKIQDLYKDAEKLYCLDGLSPSQKAKRIIERMKISHVRNTQSGNSGLFIYMREWLYLFSKNCELNDQEKDFAIHCAFGTHRGFNDFYTVMKDGLYEDYKTIIFDALERWGIIDALKLYAEDENGGEKCFAERHIPIPHIYEIINSAQFKRRYKVLDSVFSKRKQKDPVDVCVNTDGRISAEECSKLVRDATALAEQGDYDISKYELLKVFGAEQIQTLRVGLYEDIRNLEHALVNQLDNIKTKQDMEKYLELRHELGWLRTNFGPWYGMPTKETKVCKILGIQEQDRKLKNFDLKNSADIAHCTELFPLVLKYPYLFIEWYPQSGSNFDVDRAPRFVPNYNNGLGKTRVNLHNALKDKGGSVGQFLSRTVVPQELNKRLDKLERFLADCIYPTKHPGRC